MLAESEDYGIPISRDKLNIAERKYTSELAKIDAELQSEIPSEIPECMQVKWGTTNFQRWFLYDYLGIPKRRSESQLKHSLMVLLAFLKRHLHIWITLLLKHY